jgi:hypothetical protein
VSIVSTEEMLLGDQDPLVLLDEGFDWRMIIDADTLRLTAVAYGHRTQRCR